MKRIALVLTLAFGALAALAASANALAPSLELAWRPTPTTFDDVDIGTLIQLNAPVSTLQTGAGTITCEEAPSSTLSGLKGFLETNDEKTDKAEMTLGGGKLFAKVSCTNNTALGASVLVSMEPDGAQLSLSASKEKAEIKEKQASQPFYLTLSYSGGGKCHYAAKKLKGTLTITNSGEVVESFEAQKFALRKDVASTIGCPKTALFSTVFTSIIATVDNEQHPVAGLVH